MTIRELARTFKREMAVYRLLIGHPQTPRAAKICLGLAVGYALLPFDLIPDFLPVIGHLDDAILVPGLVALGLRLVSPELVARCRAQIEKQSDFKD